jgi:hypothetical protein
MNEFVNRAYKSSTNHEEYDFYAGSVRFFVVFVTRELLFSSHEGYFNSRVLHGYDFATLDRRHSPSYNAQFQVP